jgi:hypothetical protein
MSEESEQWSRVRRIYQKSATASNVEQQLVAVINQLSARVAELERRTLALEKKNQ